MWLAVHVRALTSSTCPSRNLAVTSHTVHQQAQNRESLHHGTRWGDPGQPERAVPHRRSCPRLGRRKGVRVRLAEGRQKHPSSILYHSGSPVQPRTTRHFLPPPVARTHGGAESKLAKKEKGGGETDNDRRAHRAVVRRCVPGTLAFWRIARPKSPFQERPCRNSWRQGHRNVVESKRWNPCGCR